MMLDLVVHRDRLLPDIAMAVGDLAILADGLLMGTDAPLMTIALDPARCWPVSLWNDRLSACAHRTATMHAAPMFAPALAAIRVAAIDLTDSLTVHGTEVARSVITDGTGLVLIDGPVGNDPSWLIDVASDAGTTVLLRFAPGSVLAQLFDPAP